MLYRDIFRAKVRRLHRNKAFVQEREDVTLHTSEGQYSHLLLCAYAFKILNLDWYPNEPTKQYSNMIIKVVGIAICLGAGIITRHLYMPSTLRSTPESKTSSVILNDMEFSFLLSAGIFALSFLLYLHPLGSKGPSLGDLSKHTVNDSGEALSPEKLSGRNIASVLDSGNSQHDHVEGTLRSENERLRSQLSTMTNLQDAYRKRLLESMEISRRWEEAALVKMQDQMERLECNEATEVMLIEWSRG